MNNHHTQDIEEICELALSEAHTRPLTQAEITALRWACGISERSPAVKWQDETCEI